MRAHGVLLSPVLALCLAGCVGLRDVALKPGDDHLRRGLDQLERREIDAAEQSFASAVNAYDDASVRDSVAYGWCHYGLGTVALYRQNMGKALEQYQAAIKRFEAAPSLAESGGYSGVGWTLLRAGMIHKEQRAWEQARLDLERALVNLAKVPARDHNAFFLAHHSLGYVLLNLKDFDGAIRNLAAAETGHKDTSPISTQALGEVCYNLATAHTQKRSYEDAKKYFLQSRGIFEQNAAADKKTLADIDYYLGAIYLEQKDLPQAEKYLRLAVAGYGQAIAIRRDKGDTEAVRQMEEQVKRIRTVLGN